jgi:hypothetical protein
VFVFAFPLLTVYFSKSGLDKYKNMRSEMHFLNDSIRVDFDNIDLLLQDTLNNKRLKDRLIIAVSWNQQCQGSMVDMIDSVKAVQGYFSEEDNRKMTLLIHVPNFFNTSVMLDSCIRAWDIDTSIWKFSNNSFLNQYRFEDTSFCSSLVLLDGRVSRKDNTKNYLKGPLLCEQYHLGVTGQKQKLLQNMAVIMPSKQRKSIVFKEDEKLY